MPVSNEIRKENSYWVRQRDKWRNGYSKIQREISYCKVSVAQQHRRGNNYLANRYIVQLKALQQTANTLMVDRAYISMQLRLTSYRYEQIMPENKIVQLLNRHVDIVPYSIDKEYFLMAIQEIERLQTIVDSYTFPHNDQMLRRIVNE